MQIRDSEWEQLLPHVSLGYIGAPLPVFQAVAAVVNPADIRGSWPAFKQGYPSGWITWVVTNSAIAYSELEFEANNYTSAEEEKGATLDTPIPFHVVQLWVRPLSSVKTFEVGSVGPRGTNSSWFPVDDVKLTFEDGFVITLPGQQEAGSQPEARRKIDEFLRAVRAGMSF